MRKKFLAIIGALGLFITSLIFSPISEAAHFENDNEHASDNLFNPSDPQLEYGSGGYYPGDTEGEMYAYVVFTLDTDKTYHITHPKYSDLFYYDTTTSDYQYLEDAWDDNITNGVCFSIPSAEVGNAETVKLSLTIYGYETGENYIDVFGIDNATGEELTVIKSIDLTAPSVTVTGVYVVNVDYMQSQAQILSHIVVVDDNDPNPQLVVRSTTYNAANRVCGTYQMTVYAEDVYGNRSSDFTFDIVVSDATTPSNSGFKTISQPNNVQLLEAEILNKFTVSDNYSSAENISKTLIKNDYSTNWTRPGKYEVICRATDEAGNYTDTSSFIQVVDKVCPTITGTTKTQGNNVLLTREELLALFSVEDDFSISSKITKSITTDSYSANWKKPGSYQVTCRATDEAGNYADTTSTIIVEDKTKPALAIINQDAEYNNKITDLKTLFEWEDDVSQLEKITFEIVTDNYTVNYNIKGNYTVRARVTDEAGNSAEASAVVRVVDTQKPIITVPTDISVGNSTLLETESLKSRIVVEDGYDGVITDYRIIDGESYAANYKTIGRYKFQVEAQDSSGNKQVATFYITVNDTTSPKVYYDNYYICLSEGEVLTDEMIKAFASKALGVDVSSILSVDGEYDVEVTGAYSVNLYMLDGSIQPFTISVGEIKEPTVYEFTWKNFFSSNMENWTNFNAWPAWSICAWLSWIGIGFAGVVAAAIIISILKLVVKRKR